MMGYYALYAQISNTSADTQDRPIQQINFNDRLSDALAMFPYGIHANMSVGALVAMLNIGGDTGNRMIIGGSTENRPQMADGENCIFHPPTGTLIHFKADGTISIEAKDGGNTTINVKGDLNVSGDIVADGEVTAGSVTLTGHVHAGQGSLVAPSGGGNVTGDTAVGVG